MDFECHAKKHEIYHMDNEVILMTYEQRTNRSKWYLRKINLIMVNKRDWNGVAERQEDQLANCNSSGKTERTMNPE